MPLGRHDRSACGSGSVELAQADNLEQDGLARRFDVIQCSGVRHHLEPPAQGLAVLASLLAPEWKMKLSLYIEMAHAGVVAARALIAAAEYAADRGGLRAAPQATMARPIRLISVRSPAAGNCSAACTTVAGISRF